MGLRVRRLALLAFVAAAWLALAMPGVPGARPDRDSDRKSEKRDRDRQDGDGQPDGDEAQDPDGGGEEEGPDEPEAGVEGQEPEEGADGEEECVDRAFAQSEGEPVEEAEEREESEERAAERKRKRDRDRDGDGGGRDRSEDVVDGSYIVVYEKSVEGPKRKTDELEDECDVEVDLRYSRALKGFAAELSDAEVEELEEEPDVEAVVPDRRVRADALVPLTLGDSTPTGVRRMAAGTTTSVHEASTANVAVIDSGVDLDHPDLNVTSAKDCTPDGGTAEDDDGHGTHVAGIIGARNNGSGVVGVAPNTKLFAVKVLDSTGLGYDSWIICGIDWATSTRSDGNSSNDISVANLSLGGVGGAVRSCGQTTDPLHRAICNSTAAGVTYVVAAGNDGWDFDYPSAPDTPAAYPEVLTVTAMADSDGRGGGAGTACSGDTDDRHAGFSNFAYTDQGKAHAIAAPGVCIRSTLMGGGHGSMSGTSMASPHVAGAVALCLGEGGADGPCKGKTPAQIISHMRTQAAAHRQDTPSFGFTGDPASPVGSPTEYFGYLAFPGVATTTESAPGPTTTTVPASSYSVDAGSWRSGSATSLQADDGNLLQVNSGGTKKKRTVGWAGGFTDVPNSAQGLQVTYSGANTRSCAQTLAIYRWTTASWVTLDSRSVSSETRLLKSVPGTTSDYVHTQSGAGTVVVRVSCSRKKKAFISQGDVLQLTYTQ